MKIYRLQPQKKQNMQKLCTALYRGAVLLLNDFKNQLYIFIIHFLWDAGTNARSIGRLQCFAHLEQATNPTIGCELNDASLRYTQLTGNDYDLISVGYFVGLCLISE